MALAKYADGIKHLHLDVLLLLTGEQKIQECAWDLLIFFLGVTFNNKYLKCKAYVQSIFELRAQCRLL
jgi:hypothetical protein